MSDGISRGEVEARLGELCRRVDELGRRIDELGDEVRGLCRRYDELIFGNGGSGLKDRVVMLEGFRGFIIWLVPLLFGYMMFLSGIVLKDWVLWVFQR